SARSGRGRRAALRLSYSVEGSGGVRSLDAVGGVPQSPFARGKDGSVPDGAAALRRLERRRHVISPQGTPGTQGQNLIGREAARPDLALSKENSSLRPLRPLR